MQSAAEKAHSVKEASEDKKKATPKKAAEGKKKAAPKKTGEDKKKATPKKVCFMRHHPTQEHVPFMHSLHCASCELKHFTRLSGDHAECASSLETFTSRNQHMGQCHAVCCEPSRASVA